MLRPECVILEPGAIEGDAVVEIMQVIQHAEDLDRAERFYSQLLGQNPAGRLSAPEQLVFNLGFTRLLLERDAPSAVVYLLVDDVPTAVDEARQRGVEILEEPHIVFSHVDDSLGPAGTDEWQAFIRDSEANTVGLVSHDPRHDP